MNNKSYHFKVMWPLVTLITVSIFLAGFYYWEELAYKEKILPGVQTGEVLLGGLDKDSASIVLQDYLSDESNKLIIQSPIGENIYKAKEFGVSWLIDDTVNSAFIYGHTGWWGQKIGARLWAIVNSRDIALQYNMDNDIFWETVEVLKGTIDQTSQNGVINIDKNSQIAIVIPAVSGRELNTVLLQATLKKHWQSRNSGTINAPVITTEPQLTTAMLQIITDKINQHMTQEYVLEIDTKFYTIETKELWGWIEIVQQSNGVLVRFSPQKLTIFLETLKSKVDQTVQSAKFKMSGDQVMEFQIHTKGVELDIVQTAELIQKHLLSEKRNFVAKAKYTEPDKRLEDLNDLGVHELVARGESNFAGSPQNRRHNIRVGASKFDLVLVAPHETFSFNKILGEVEAHTGYLPELVIKGDETTPEFGGGLCQISTTTFRAVLQGGYPVDARRNHSYRVSYYEPAGTDATVYLPYPDFRFTNDTDAHILIDTWIDEENDNLFFDFYSTILNRKVELEEPRIYNITKPPEPVYIETSELPEGEIKKIDNAHFGADVILYRHIYDLDGKKIRTDEFNSHYVPWPDKYLVGVIAAPMLETDLKNILPEDTATEPPILLQ